MREWFIVGCKLLGLYFLYEALTSTVSVLMFLASASEGTFPGTSATQIILTNAFNIVSGLGFAILLIVKTEWIADKFKLTGIMQDSVSARGGNQLQPGITLLGIYIFCTKIGKLVKIFVAGQVANRTTDQFAASQPKGLIFSLDFVEPVVTLVVSMILIFGSKYIASFLTKERQAE